MRSFDTGYFESEIDFAGLEGLDIKPLKIVSSSSLLTLHLTTLGSVVWAGGTCSSWVFQRT